MDKGWSWKYANAVSKLAEIQSVQQKTSHLNFLTS